jgi:Fe2+ transport system protein FeoA
LSNSKIYQRNATDLKLGESSVIKAFENEEISSKFIEIGCLPKSPIRLIRRGPAGRTMYLRINGNAFALRKEEASQILLKF